MKKATILITGGTGYIGSNLVRALLTQGHSIRLLVRNKEKAVKLFGSKVKITTSDLAKDNAFSKLPTNFDYIFHLAAAVSYQLPSKESYYQVNQHGTQQLISFATKQKRLQKLVYVSSVGVYGPVKNPPANEQTTHQPENDYEHSKNLGEKQVTTSNLPYVVIQPTLAYGPGDTQSGMFRLFMAAMHGKFLSIGFKPILMHPVYIDNLIQALLKAAYSSVVQQTFIIGDTKPITLKELASTIARENNTKLLPIVIPKLVAVILGFLGDFLQKMGFPAPLSSATVHFMTHHRAFSIKKAQKLLGYLPKVSSADGISRTVSWYQKNI